MAPAGNPFNIQAKRISAFPRKLGEWTRLSAARARMEQLAAVILTSLVVTFGLHQFQLNDIEAALYDLRITGATQNNQETNITLIALDDRSLRVLEEQTPLPFNQQISILENLISQKPKAIGWLLDFPTHPIATTSEPLWSSTQERRFIDAVSKYESQGGVFILGTGYSPQGEVPPPYPLDQLDHAPAIIHRDGNIFSEDKITRRALWSISDAPTFHQLMARRLNLISENQKPKGTYRDLRAEYFFFRWRADPALQLGEERPTDVRVLSNNPWQYYSWLDIAHGKVEASTIQGKVVLVGSLSRDQSTDFAFTPWSRKPFSNPKLAVHATIIDAIAQQQSLIQSSRALTLVLTFLASIFVTICVVATTPIQGLMATLSLAVSFIFLSHLLFVMRGYWLLSAHVLVGIISSYYIAVPYRLYQEYRARWEFEEHSKILTKVEEMKRNFVSLVTHDLKTPVARIQGLAEILSKKAADRLNERDQFSIKQILNSTEDLNRFITSILELNKIDSDGDFALRLESRDINDLINLAVESFKAQSKLAEIQIETDLEPQFPIKLDIQLMRRVLHNLIDNALKYSNRGARIKIVSRDLNTQDSLGLEGVEIRVSDQGIGMGPEELKNLFTRFYRVKNDHTTRITGTGLGLYLSKYFIEAHGGRLTVESQAGTGSSFIIQLLVDPAQSKKPGKTQLSAGGQSPGLTQQINTEFEHNLKPEEV